MGLYESWILPGLLDTAMRNRRLHPYREKTIGAARGFVLEVGAGSGMNWPFYTRAVDRVCALDPSPKLLRLAIARIEAVAVPVSLLRGSAEQLPFGNAAFDTVVTTWTLCTIGNPIRALTEMRRVLAPTGRLLFVEHGLAPETHVARWQHRLTPCWKHMGGGCHLDRRIDDLIRAAGFRLGGIETGYMRGPKVMTFMYQGWAQP